MEDINKLIKSLELRIETLEKLIKDKDSTSNMFGRSYSKIGDSNSDFLIKTKGQIKILWGNKFIDLIKDGKVNSDTNFIFKSSKVGTKNGIYVIGDKVVLLIDGNEIPLESGGNSYISFLTEQELNPSEKYTALKNIGFVYDNISDVGDLQGGIVYIEDKQKLYIVVNGVMKEFNSTVPNPFKSLFVISKNDTLDGALVIKGEGTSNSIKFDSARIYSKSQSLNIDAKNEVLININGNNTLVINDNAAVFNLKVITNSIQSSELSNTTGFRLYSDGVSSNLDIDNIRVRNKLIESSIHVDLARRINGSIYCTKAGFECSNVDIIYDDNKDNTLIGYRCFFINSNNSGLTLENLFEINDYAFSETINGNLSHRWWRKVIGKGSDYIDVSAVTQQFEPDSYIPSVGDIIIQLGNASDTDRQGAVIIDSNGLKVYNGINDFKLPAASLIIDANYDPGKEAIDASNIDFINKSLINGNFVIDENGNIKLICNSLTGFGLIASKSKFKGISVSIEYIKTLTSYNISQTDDVILIDSTSDVTINFPSDPLFIGKLIYLKKTKNGTGNIILSGTFDDTYIITDSGLFVFDGTKWFKL